MDFAFTPQQDTFRREVLAFIQQEVTPDLVEETSYRQDSGPLIRRFVKRMGAKGWLSMTWPKRFGGQERSSIERLILSDELEYHGAPYGAIAERAVAPVLMHSASRDLQEEFLPRIAGGDIDFAIGYTEPEAGSDLASLKTRAVEDGDDFVVTGQKMFNSGCHWAEYHWLAVRTNDEAPKHKGISVLIVDLNTPGITVKPLWTMGGWRTNMVFYDNVRVPRRNLVGEQDRGFYHIAAALDLERMQVTGSLRRHFDDFVAHVRADGVLRKLSPHEAALLRWKLAGHAIDIETCRLLSYRTAWLQSKGIVPNYEASQIKVFYKETYQRFAHTCVHALGLFGQIQRGDRRAPLDGVFEHLIRGRVLGTIAGGSSEIQRNIIATRGLGLPR